MKGLCGQMGFYLNNANAYSLFRKESTLPYFVDKTEILSELVSVLDGTRSVRSSDVRGISQTYVCLTRPRRFGKTVMANMIASFFCKGVDFSDIFDTLQVSGHVWYREHLNQHNVIYINFNKMPENCTSYDQYIRRIRNILVDDLTAAYPDVKIREWDAVWDILSRISEHYCGEKFIFVFDEWDFICHQNFVTEQNRKEFTRFLSQLLKDEAYVEMAYMTGILPIAKYSSGSEMNMFCEYSMVTEGKFSEYFGFTEEEVDELYARYQAQETEHQNVTREGLRIWYDGYYTRAGIRMYNPRSVVLALSNNNLGSYWTSSGPYDELFYYISANVDEVRNDIGLMVADVSVPAMVREYAVTSMELKTRDEILSAMVVYGFLNYENGYVSIPNKELMDQFAYMVQREPSLGSVYRLTKESGRMLMATKAGDTKTMEEILEFVHNTESPLLLYNNEAELASVLRLVYLQARDHYRIEREDKAGLGYVDYIFYPFVKSDDAIIIELKVDHTAEEAIQQIKDRRYALRFEGRIGQNPEYTGRILAVGIAYSREDKQRRHICQVEVLRERN